MVKRVTIVVIVAVTVWVVARPVYHVLNCWRSDPADNEKIHAASVVLSSAAPDSAKYRKAYDNLVSIARSSDEDVNSLDALTILARQARPTFRDSVRTVPVQNTSADQRTMSMSEIADRLEHHHKSQAFHKQLAVEVRARNDPEQAGRVPSPDVKH